MILFCLDTHKTFFLKIIYSECVRPSLLLSFIRPLFYGLFNELQDFYFLFIFFTILFVSWVSLMLFIFNTLITNALFGFSINGYRKSSDVDAARPASFIVPLIFRRFRRNWKSRVTGQVENIKFHEKGWKDLKFSIFYSLKLNH